MSTSEQQPAASEVPPLRPSRPAHARPRVAPAQPPQTQGSNSSVKQTPADAGVTADELRTFIAQSRGKSPQEVLGMIAQSGLVQSTSLAAGLVVGFLLLLTIVPYAMGDRGKPDKPKPIASGTQNETNPTTDAPQSKPSTPAAGAKSTPASTTTSGDPALKALGIDETTTADPDKNPLENSLDDLLDKIKK